MPRRCCPPERQYPPPVRLLREPLRQRRQPNRAEVIGAFGKHNVSIVAGKGPSFDLRTAYGRGMADMATAFDSMEGEVKSERVSAAIGDRARRGLGRRA